MVTRNIGACRKFMENLAARGKPFSSEDEREAFTTDFVGNDKKLMPVIKAFIRNNCLKASNPKWSLKDLELLAAMATARENYKIQADETEEREEEEELPAALETVEEQPVAEEQPAVAVPNQPEEEESVEQKPVVRELHQRAYEQAPQLPDAPLPVPTVADGSDDIIALLHSIQAKQDVILNEVLEVRNLRGRLDEFDEKITALVRNRILVPPVPQETENQPPAVKKMKHVTIKEELIERAPNVQPYRP